MVLPRPRSIENPNQLFDWIESIKDLVSGDITDDISALEEAMEDRVEEIETISEAIATVYIQDGEPLDANTGDFWVDTDAAAPTTIAEIVDAELVEVEAAIARIDPGTVGDYRTALSWDEVGAPSKAGIPVSPLLFGASGDGVTDDTVALNAYFIAMKSEPSGDVSYGNGFILDGHNRTYLISGTIDIFDFWALKLRNFHFLVGANITGAALLFRGCIFGEVEDVTVTAVGNWSGFTADYGIQIESGQDTTTHETPAQVGNAYHTLTNCRVIDIKTKVAFAVGIESSSFQVDNIRFFGCQAHGQTTPSSPDATWYQSGFQFGNSMSGNVLSHYCYGCVADGFTNGIFADAVDVYWFGGFLSGNVQNVRMVGAHTLLVEGMRSERSTRMFLSISGSELFAPTVRMSNIEFSCDALAADGFWFHHVNGGTILLQGIDLTGLHLHPNYPASEPVPAIRMSAGGAPTKYLRVTGLRTPVAIEQCHNLTLPFSAIIDGYIQYDPSTGLTTASQTGPVLIGETAINAMVGAGAPDITFYRKTSLAGWYSDERFHSNVGFDARGQFGATDAIRVFYDAGSQTIPAFIIQPEALLWGDGVGGAQDTSLGRTAANVLAMGANDVLKTGQNVTGSRPNAATVGEGAQFFDTTLDKPIWSDGATWRDAAGTAV